jgi:F-type H+-transporting ATPase subunit b
MQLILAAGLLDINPGLIILKLIIFVITLWVLSKYAWKPIVGALNEREKNIDSSIQRAELALAEAKQIQADNQKARREAEQEAQRIMREAREAAERLRAEEIDKTQEKIRSLQEQAKAEIEREKQGALNTLRNEVADLAIQAAEKILQESLDDGRQRRIVQDFIGGMSKN